MSLTAEQKTEIKGVAAIFSVVACVAGPLWYHSTFKADRGYDQASIQPSEVVQDVAHDAAETLNLEFSRHTIEQFMNGEIDMQEFQAEVEKAFYRSSGGGYEPTAPGH